jgi:hypothetical protein
VSAKSSVLLRRQWAFSVGVAPILAPDRSIKPVLGDLPISASCGGVRACRAVTRPAQLDDDLDVVRLAVEARS